MQPNQKKIGEKKDFRNYDLVFASMKTIYIDTLRQGYACSPQR